MSVPYSVTLAFQSIIKEKWINILSILTIGSALLINSIAFFIVFNVDAATRYLPDRFSLILYLDENLGSDKVDSTIDTLKKNSAVSSVKYISKEEAMKELKGMLKDSSYLFEGLGENPLPDTLEVKLRKDSMRPDAVKKLAGEALRIKGVKEAEYGEKFVSALHVPLGCNG